MLTSLVACVGGSMQDQRPRPDPPPPTPLDFPRSTTSTTPKSPLTPENTRTFHTTYTSLKKPTDVRLSHLEQLNITVEHDIPLEELIPLDPLDGTSPLPPTSWNSLPTTQPPPSTLLQAHDWPPKLLSTGKPRPTLSTYLQRLSELSYPNADVFHVVQRRKPVPGKPPARPGQYYRFWQALDLVAQWWDTSCDEERSAGPDPETGNTYVGRRIGAGRDMPELYREDCVRGFVEVVGWEFGCRMQAPRAMPRLALRTSLFPSRFTSVAYRQPATPAEQRAGLLEGPVLAMQCRPETCFRQPGEAVGEGQAEILDLLREIVGALILAQERAREGKEEKRPGVGKWWCEAPRWGGGKGGEVGNQEGGNTDEPVGEGGRGRSVSRGKKVEGFRKLDRQSSGVWDRKVRYLGIGRDGGGGGDDIFLISSINHHISILHLRVSNSYLRFLESGALPRTPVSPSLKNHQSQSQPQPSSAGTPLPTDPTDPMDISPPPDISPASGGVVNGELATPLAGVGTGSGNGSVIAKATPGDWYNPRLRRSRWFDLLERGDRVEAMRGLWGVFGWLMRDCGGGGEGEGGEVGK